MLELIAFILLHIGGISLIGFGLVVFFSGVYHTLKTILSFFGDWFAYGFRVAAKAPGHPSFSDLKFFVFCSLFAPPPIYAGLCWLDIFWKFGLPQLF